MVGVYTLSICGYCNRKCSYCIASSPCASTKKAGEPGAAMNADKTWVIEEANKFDGIVAITGGCPFLHPDIEEILDSIDKPIVVYTHGDFIHKYIKYTEYENIYWVLSDHPQYRSPEEFADVRDNFPIDRCLVHHLAFNDIEDEARDAYVGNYSWFQSGDVRCQGNYHLYAKSSYEYTKDEMCDIIENSSFAYPDGIKFKGVCDKAFDEFIGDLDNSYPDTHRKLNEDPMLKIPKDNMINMIKTHCGKTCNSVRTNIIISKWIGGD